MLLHPHSPQPSVQGQRKPLCWRSLERRARSPGKEAQVPPRGDLGDLLAYLLLLSACPRAVPLPLFIERVSFWGSWPRSRRRVGSCPTPLRGGLLGHVTIAPYSPKKGQRIPQMQYLLQLPSRTS